MKGTTKFILIIGVIIVVLLAIMLYHSLSVKKQNNQVVDKGINPGEGNLSSSVVVVEFSDFQCPACKAAEPIVNGILRDYNIAFYYRNFPLPIHSNSVIAAEAAECANEQGKFWEYHDVLFQHQDALDAFSLEKYAEQLNLSTAQFNICLESGKYRPQINKDVNDGVRLDVQGTPTFFINGKMVLGGREELIRQAIERELNKTR